MFSRLANRGKYFTNSSNSCYLLDQCLLQNGPSFSWPSSSTYSSHRLGLISAGITPIASSLSPRLVKNGGQNCTTVSLKGLGPDTKTKILEELCTHGSTSCQRRNVHSTTRRVSSRSSTSRDEKTNRHDTVVRFELVENEGRLIVHHENGNGAVGETLNLPLIWLRDHCRCQSCYNHDTQQKDNVGQDLFEEHSGKLRVSKAVLQDEDATLVIYWKDGHVSKYSFDWLVSNSHKGCKDDDNNSPFLPPPAVSRVLWDRATITDKGGPLPVPFTSHVDTHEGLRQTLCNLLDYGFALVTEAPPSLEGTQKVTDRVAPVQETFFGGMWQFTSDGSFSDTAYNSGFLSAHTDNTYLEMPAGIQVFQCLGHDGKGGETLLVDGFHAVDTLRKSQPDAVRFLSNHLVPHEYKESPSTTSGDGGSDGSGGDGSGSVRVSPGYHMYTLCKVIEFHPATGDPLYLRFNPYDRAPLNTIPADNLVEFYHSYQLLGQAIDDPKGQLWVKLTPGTVLLIDNWRVLHGRSAFNGTRVMCGCYLRRDDWMSRVRVMGLLE